LPNVPDDGSPLAFGAKGCYAADVQKVPKAWELGASVRSAFLFLFAFSKSTIPSSWLRLLLIQGGGDSENKKSQRDNQYCGV
jgi:hypothetical protein